MSAKLCCELPHTPVLDSMGVGDVATLEHGRLPAALVKLPYRNTYRSLLMDIVLRIKHISGTFTYL